MIEVKNAQQMLDIIAPIPADKFCSYSYSTGDGECCLFGHISKALTGDPIPRDSFDVFGARPLTAKFLREKHNIHGMDGADVNNDNTVNGYNEPEIKERVMHLLNDMVESGY